MAMDTLHFRTFLDPDPVQPQPVFQSTTLCVWGGGGGGGGGGGDLCNNLKSLVQRFPSNLTKFMQILADII
jgi:hypothetical protein